ncbi:MAG TPA: FAD-binding protein [Fimbriimonadaceae bacterium]|nr:FAD-binding protein [Fimbriimonadaceae bacterium]
MKLLHVAFGASDADSGGGLASALGMEFDVLEIGSDAPPADSLAKAIAQRAQGYSHVSAVSSMQSKDVMARVAGILEAAMVTDVIQVDSATVFKRPIVAGTMVETVETLVNPVVLTFRPAGFKGRASAGSSTAIVSVAPEKATRISVSARGGSRPDLTQAKVVVSGGRPLKDAATFESVIGGLADALGGAAGATRAAVDSGIAANELQVGQTGKIVAPDLYIAAGISGSTQHMAGIKDSKVIVAINKDPDAPIFEFADFGLVADLFEAIPVLKSKI